MFFMFLAKVYNVTQSLCKIISINFYMYLLHLSTRHHLEHFHRANDTDSNHNKWQ